MATRAPLNHPLLASRLDLQSLRIFRTVAQCGSLTEAAVREHLVVSAVSRRITNLEQLLGLQLLERHRDGVAPTAAGVEFLERIQEIEAVIERIDESAATHRAGVRGVVRLHANTSALLDQLPRRIARFLADYPDVEVNIQEWDSIHVVRSVREGAAHIGIFSSYVPASGLEVHRFARNRLVIVAPKGHPLAQRKQVRFAETLDYDYVVIQDGQALSTLLTHMQGVANRFSAAMKIRIKASTAGAACRFVEAGVGIALVPVTSAELFAARMPLEIIELRDSWARIRYDLGVRSADALPGAARLLFEHLRAG